MIQDMHNSPPLISDPLISGKLLFETHLCLTIIDLYSLNLRLNLEIDEKIPSFDPKLDILWKKC